MLLGEPPRTQFDLNFVLFNIPVRVHPLFWLVALLMGAQRQDPASVLTWILAVFLAILVHELGHAFAMRAYGFLPWITLYGMGGLTAHNQGFNYASRGTGSWGQILISLAGPGAGFLLAFVILVAAILSGQQIFLTPIGPLVFGIMQPRLADLVNTTLFICVAWGVVNLLPIYPLDGGQIARELFLKFSSSNGIQQSLMLSCSAAICMSAVGLLLWKSLFVALLFGYLAFTSYATLQAYRGRGPW